MKPSHRKDVIIARVIFGFLCVALLALVISLLVFFISKTSEKIASANSESESESEPLLPTTEIIDIPIETETTIEQTIYVKTTTSGVNMRSEATTDASIVTVLPAGAVLVLESEENGWAKVTYQDFNGFVSTDYLQEISAEEAEQASKGNGHIVCIDPGHQTHGDNTKEANGPGSSTMKARVTGGTSGRTTKVTEYQLNLDISLKLQDELVKRGYIVFMTRSVNDVNISNKERAEYATSVNAEISVRIHANGSESSSANGAMTLTPSSKNPYVSNLADDSKKLSTCILDSYCAATGMKKEGVQANDTMTGINWSTVPVTILEMGYMTNPTDDKNMQNEDFQKKMVMGIADGIDAYFR